MNQKTKGDMVKKRAAKGNMALLMKKRMMRGIRLFVNRMVMSRRYRILVFRYSLAVIISVICIPMMLSLAFVQPAEANDGSEEVFYKYYHRIEVSEGDTLWSIAQQNYHAQEQTIREYIEEVQQINHRYSETVYAGEELMVPYYSTEFY